MKKRILLSAILCMPLGLWGCSPKVQVSAPEKPITINLNVKIQHEILVKVDKQIDTLFSEESELF